MSRSYSKKKNSNNKYKSLRRTRKVNYKRSKKRSIKRNMSKKTQKGSGIWKRIMSKFSRKKSKSTSNKTPLLINNTEEKLKAKLEDIGTKADELLIKLESNEDRSVLGIKTNESILEGIKKICKKKDKDKAIKELKESKRLKPIASIKQNEKKIEQWNKDINEIKDLIEKL